MKLKDIFFLTVINYILYINMTIKTLYLPRLITDDELGTLKGTFIDDGYIVHTIDSDVDIYDEETKEFICSFRKRRLKTSKIGFDNFKHLSVASRGRGASAGPIDPTSQYWKKKTLHKTKGFRTSYLKKDGTPSKMKVHNQVLSTNVGFFDKMKLIGIEKPCRLTYHTTQALKEFEAGKPFIYEIDRWFNKMRPIEYKIQIDRANLQPKYKIDHTSFSTITMNRNFRTALHQDVGDYNHIACLTVNEYGKYNGGLYTIPGYAIGINLREGDMLVANVGNYHSNTEIYTTAEQDEYNAKLPKLFKENWKVGTIGTCRDYARISYVCYLREKLINCE